MSADGTGMRFLQTIQAGLADVHGRDAAPSWQAPEINGGGVLASAFAVTGLAVGSIGAAALGLAAYLREFTGRAPAVSLERRLASLWFGRSLYPQGWRIPAVRDPVTGDYQGLDGWIRIHANAPHHRQRALRVLGCDARPQSVEQAVSRRPVQALEDDLVAAGACAAVMRSASQWAGHPQGRAIAQAPLFLADEGLPEPTPPAAMRDPGRPLSDVRVLDLTRVLAGPVSTRFLAGYGARVVRVDPPSWTEPGMVPEVTLGKYCVGLDLNDPGQRRRFEALLAQADVLVHGYRPDALENLGLGAQARQRIRPGLVDVSLDAYGWTGPWRMRRGFDSLVQMSCGIAHAGMQWKEQPRPTPLPVQALDQASGYLMAAAVLHGLVHRRRTGMGSIVRLALARTAHLLMSETAQTGLVIDDAVPDDLDPWVERTVWGPAQRLSPPCALAGIPMRWERPAGPLRADPPMDAFPPQES